MEGSREKLLMASETGMERNIGVIGSSEGTHELLAVEIGGNWDIHGVHDTSGLAFLWSGLLRHEWAKITICG
jgi:hypothetical protein